MIMRDGDLATVLKQQEENEAHKLIEKEQRAKGVTFEGTPKFWGMEY